MRQVFTSIGLETWQTNLETWELNLSALIYFNLLLTYFKDIEECSFSQFIFHQRNRIVLRENAFFKKIIYMKKDKSFKNAFSRWIIFKWKSL